MKKPIKAKTSRSALARGNGPLLRSLLKQLDELLKTNHRQSQEFQLLKEEVESLRRELSLTMESLADLPFVSGVLH
jgi:phage shock protein A